MGAEFCQRLLTSIKIIIWFLYFNLLIWCMTLIYLHILKSLCIPGMKPIWSWYYWCFLFIIVYTFYSIPFQLLYFKCIFSYLLSCYLADYVWLLKLKTIYFESTLLWLQSIHKLCSCVTPFLYFRVVKIIIPLWIVCPLTSFNINL